MDDGEGGGGVGGGVGDGLELLLGGVALLGLVALLGEEDQALLVGLEALDVGGQGLLGDVLAAGIDGDTDGGGVLAGDASGLDSALLESSIIASNLPQRAHIVNQVTEDMARRACRSLFRPVDQRTFSSARVKPRPARTRRLYLMVGHRTTGRSLSMGRGATAAALAWRAFLRETFLPGCMWFTLSDRIQMVSQYARMLKLAVGVSPSRPQLGVGMCSWKSYLVEVGSDPTLPILAEVCEKAVSIDNAHRMLSRPRLRTGERSRDGDEKRGQKTNGF